MASGSGRSSAWVMISASANAVTLMRNALPAGERPRGSPRSANGPIRFGPMIEPAAPPQTISPIARPRCAAVLTSAAA